MAEPTDSRVGQGDALQRVATLAGFAGRAGHVLRAVLKRRITDPDPRLPDPLVVAGAYLSLALRLVAEPMPVLARQADLVGDQIQLLLATLKRLAGEEVEPVVQPARGDRRFKSDDWSDSIPFDTLKQSYLLTARTVTAIVENASGLDRETERKVRFFTRLALDALAPSNFLPTNPVALRTAKESRGTSLIRGIDALLRDFEAGDGRLRIATTDEAAFRLGENVATTHGKVVFQNDLMQLIQYAPATAKVYRRPLVIVPPWINKYYVLDLQPGNSLVRWLVEQGFTVFMVSWVNPDEGLAGKRFDDYMLEGPLAALDAVEKATGEKAVTMAGYCIGGTLLACTLAWLAAKGDKRIGAATFLTTMVDFEEPGDLGVFIDERQLSVLEDHMQRKGYLSGRMMAGVFSAMRDNDMIWSYVVNNYLLGIDPPAFDLLAWNADATRMPAMMHGFYLRRLYLENKLREAGGIRLAGEAVDLGRIAQPSYVVATQEDHIAPWRSAYAATRLFGGPTRFVLSGSGHIAGVVNPPSRERYGHWTAEANPADPEAWFAAAERHEGSWWPDWANWLARRSGAKVNARFPGDGKLKAIEDAPGSYVKVRDEG